MTSRQPDYHIVIPARFASERLPGKVLLELAGEPMLLHVWKKAMSSSAQTVVIATDDDRILEAAEGFGAQAVMTDPGHHSGSDRIAECAMKLGWRDTDLIVNLQGDEPLMPAACLDQVAKLLETHPECDVASLYWPIAEAEEVHDPNIVKVVTAADGTALYFSRSPVPYPRGFKDPQAAMAEGITWNRHLGLYAYRLDALRRYTSAPPSPLERAERLEQLRVMEQGGHIAMARACQFIPAGVDTADDLERVQKLIECIT
jgi:3-deoxy-manno-octulosonate cytidylyltransferase (CMP-KDO synthetase)